MVSNSPDPAPAPEPPKPLKGVGIIISAEKTDGATKTLGVIFAPNQEKLIELIKAIHGTKMTVNLSAIRGGSITLDRP